MIGLDSHQHYWETARSFRWLENTWITGKVGYAWQQLGLDRLDRDFLPRDLEPQLAAAGVGQSVVVQVLNNLGETLWLLDQAEAHASVAGVVGWVDLTQPVERLEAALAGLAHRPKLCAIRHLVEFEPDDDWLLRPDVLAGLRVLEQRDMAYDLLLKPRHLTRVPALSEQLPGLRLVIDHLAKPDIKNGVLQPWARDLAAAAQNPRLFCKLSGMVTEADHAAWQPADLVPFVEAAVRAFGLDRLMFGSDWPVCTLAADYPQVGSALRHALRQILGGLDEATEQALFHDNAAKFYRLAPAG